MNQEEKPVKVIHLDTGKTEDQTVDGFITGLKDTLASIPDGEQHNDYQEGDIVKFEDHEIDYNKMTENMVSYYRWERGGDRKQGLKTLIEEYTRIFEYNKSEEKAKCIEIAKRKLVATRFNDILEQLEEANTFLYSWMLTEDDARVCSNVASAQSKVYKALYEVKRHMRFDPK